MSANAKPIYVLKIAPGIEKPFMSVADIRDFTGQESKFWGAMLSRDAVNNAGFPLAAIRDFYREISHRQLEHFERLAQTPNPATLPDIENRMVPFTEGRQFDRAFCSLNPDDARIMEVFKTDPLAALMGAWARARGTGPDTNSIHTTMRGEVMLALMRWNMGAPSPTSFAPAWQDWMSQVQQNEAAAQKRRAENEQVLSALSTASAATIDAMKEEIEANKNSREEAAKAAEAMRADQNDKLEKLRIFYNSKLTLMSPVDYWKGRARRQVIWAALWVLAFVIMSGGTAYLIWELRGPLRELIGDGRDINLAAVPILAAAALPVVWVLKHISRQFIDCMIDSRDASQRSVQAMTYLALQERSKDLPESKQADLSIALNALFRPGPAQPSEDGIPLPLIELFKSRN
ncbi:hypothetical protein [Ferrovibrio sp.]|uniref:hypothetical protein n=1 Tax=Ferrovibrio sp. TaxID=1917215 RepID=UPI003D138404